MSTHANGTQTLRGRATEQRLVRDLLRRAQQGAGGVVLVEGEPGIGKTRLLREATDEAAGYGFSLATGAADQLGRAIPFFALRAALGAPFAADGPDRDRSAAPEWWISQARAHLAQRASATPVLVGLDDLQWASPFTLAALRTLPQELKRHPVAWLLARASTPQQDTEYLFDILEKDGATRINLAPLDEDAVAALLTAAFGAPPDQGLAELARGAAGNPSLLTELIRGLGDHRAVRVSAGRAVLVSGRLPRRVHLVTQHRLDGLGQQARNLLVTAAVLGPSFRLEDTAEMLGQTPAGLLPALEEAMEAGIVAATDTAFSFRHELLRGALGETTPWPARKALHRQFGQLLLGRDKDPARAAGHLLQAADRSDPASLADLDAAAAQTLRSAPQTAAALALRALELTPPADSGARRRAVAAAEALTAAGRLDRAARLAQDTLATPLPPVAEARLRCALSCVLYARGQADDAAGQAELVLARPQLPHDLREEALTAQLLALGGPRDARAGPLADRVLADPSQHYPHTTTAALTARAVIAWDHGRIGEAVGLLREAARNATGISPDARHPQPLLELAAALVNLGQLEEAGTVLHAADQPALDGIPARAELSILRARVHLAQGRLPDADDAARSPLASAQRLGADRYAWAAQRAMAAIALRRGDIAAAAEHAASAGPQVPAAEHADAGPQVPGSYAHTETILAQAQVTEARDGPAAALGLIRQAGADLAARPGMLAGDPARSGWLVRTALAAGDRPLADRIAGIAVTLADANPEFPALAAAAAHSHGLVTRDPGLLAEAAARYPDPWARASAAEDCATLGCAAEDLAGLTGTARNQAVGRLKAALDGYRQAGADRDQARVRRRLRELGVRRRHWAAPAARPATGWDSLTGTEQAVCRLVAQGLGNNQVAAHMYISTHTVAHHLRQVFRKLQITSRVELARIVIEETATSS